MNILIVDDIAINRKLLRAQLEAEAHTVTEAADGVEALQILARETIDAVISDILMPRMDGYRLCHEIRKSAAWSHLPFILFSSTYTSPADVRLGTTVGADQFIAKPAPVATIIGALRLATTAPVARSSELPGETSVLQAYSTVLVAKLEEKNSELQTALDSLQRAHDRIAEINARLEHRVAERTAELEKTNDELRATLAEVKVLSGLLPICAYCKKIRDDKNYWQSVEGYISHHTAAEFTHGCCPDCYEKQSALLDRLFPDSLPPSS